MTEPAPRLIERLAQLSLRNGIILLAALALYRLTRGRARIIRYYLVAQPVPTSCSCEAVHRAVNPCASRAHRMGSVPVFRVQRP